MPLFQERIVQKYLKQVDEQEIEIAYDNFKTHYSPQRIQNIRTLKEEAFQEQFIKEIFGSVLGYSIFPDVPHNIEIEKKNESNAKKADGAIVKEKNVLGVIELKDNKTKNLDKVADQAFGYKHNHKDCSYVISSNFHKLRFYIDDATEYEEFDLYNLDKETFKRFYLYLRKEGLLDKNVPKLLRQETKFHEENITKKLYKDYSSFKNSFYSNIVKNNPEHDKLLLFKKAQKFLDRILFILFAEDKDLIPHNTVVKIVESWSEADDFHYLPLYEMLNILFGHLDKGHTYKDGTKIPAYNGGLFAEDEVLRGLKVDDKVLKDDLLTLSKYDFNTDVDVNILGHIFEHSLSEIEEVEATLRGEVADKSKGKRKKDGVFYTPKYITKYIVDNTVGKLCEEKKAELGLDKDFDVFDYQTKGGKLNAKGKELYETIDAYRDWLLGLKILDPACGSGAFLNQALNFLIDEHNFIDDLVAELTNTPLRLFDTELAILENNIYGVDINEESIEIAKLSLWLRTAQPGRKLSNLNNNIKCGNSLIDDLMVAGDKAFRWEEEFPKVFAKGGFNVVIGNPPYVRKQGLMEHYPELCELYESKFQSATGNYDIYALFMEHSYDLINDQGIVSFILPHKFLVADFGVGIRQFFTEKKAVESILHFGSQMVFADASTYTCIINLDKKEKDKVYFKKLEPSDITQTFEWDYMDYNNLTEKNWDLQNQKIFDLIGKLKAQPLNMNDVFTRIFVGMQTSLDAVYVFEGVDKGNFIQCYNPKYDYHFQIEKELVKPFIKGNEIKKYCALDNKHYVLFPYDTIGKGVSEKYIKENLPKTFAYLKQFEAEIRGRENGKMDIDEGWYLYIYQKNHEKFPYPKIMTQEISLGCNMTYDEKGKFYHPTTIYSFVKNEAFDVDDKFYLGILNSKIMWFFLRNTGTELRGGYFRFKTNYLKPFPLPEIPENPEIIIGKVESILEMNRFFDEEVNKVCDHLLAEYEGLVLTKRLQTWYELEFSDFIKELNKAVKKAKLPTLSKEDQIEWTSTFKKYKENAMSLKQEIDAVDREIDQMVYALYGLSEDEIKIVEEA